MKGGHRGNGVHSLIFIPGLMEMWSSSEESEICVWSLVYDDAEVFYLVVLMFCDIFLDFLLSKKKKKKKKKGKRTNNPWTLRNTMNHHNTSSRGEGKVSDLCWLRDTFACSVSSNGTAVIWEGKTCEAVQKIDGSLDSINRAVSCDLGECGLSFWTSSWEGVLQRWEERKGFCLSSTSSAASFSSSSPKPPSSPILSPRAPPTPLPSEDLRK